MSEIDLAIVTPIWQQIPDQVELARIQHSLKRNPDFHHYFLAPASLNTKFYSQQFPDSDFSYFDSKYFRSIQSYNSLMLKPDIYETFINYQQILILQLDAILINSIPIEIFLEFDYIGAPWEKEPSIFHFGSAISVNSRLSKLLGVKVPVGNGGLSVRKPSTFLECFTKKKTNRILEKINHSHSEIPNEDVIWSYLHTVNKSKLPTARLASEMFLESGASFINEVPTQLIGFHDLETFNSDLEKRILKHAI